MTEEDWFMVVKHFVNVYLAYLRFLKLYFHIYFYKF